MKITKTSFLSLLFLLIYCQGIGQQKTKDESNYPKKGWFIGVGLGNIMVKGDVKSINTQLSESIMIGRRFNNWFGLQLKYARGNAKGLDANPSVNFAKNPAWNTKYFGAWRSPSGPLGVIKYDGTPGGNRSGSLESIYYNYKSNINNLSLLAAFTLPIPFSKPKFGINLNFGPSITFSKVAINTQNSQGTYAGLFKNIATAASSGVYKNSKDVIKALKKEMDNSYETNAEKSLSSNISSFNWGTGFFYQINKRLSIGFDISYIFSKNDLLDGQRWTETNLGDALLTKSYDKVVVNTIYLHFFF